MITGTAVGEGRGRERVRERRGRGENRRERVHQSGHVCALMTHNYHFPSHAS